MNLQLASKFVAKYATIPILESICFRSNGTITATDMECSFVEQIDKAIGDLCVTAKVLTRSQKILWSCNFKITWDKMLIASATWMVELNWREVSDYIHIPVIQWDEYVMNAKALLKWLSSVVDAVREKNFSPVLTWIYVHEEEWQLNFVWTNSFLLKHISFDKEKEPRIVGWMKMILPVVHVRKLIEVLKACTDMDDVRITVGENSVAFATIKYQVVMSVKP